MTNKRVLLGLTGLGVLGLAAIVGAILSWTWLIVVGLVGMAAVIGVVVLNTNLLVRAGRSDIVKVRAAMTKAAAPEATPLDESLSPEANLLETVRLLQSQYVGRLDRAQSAFERAAATLTGHATAPDGATDPFGGLPRGSVVLLHQFNTTTLAQAKVALASGLEVQAVVSDSADREKLAAAGIAHAVTQVADTSAAPHPLTVVLPSLDS